MAGPPGVGDDIKIRPDTITVGGLKLYIYSPTDCIRDRLASYIHFRARECLDQAALVARNYPFNRTKVRELVRRQSKNTRYSLRAFAHQLEIHPSALSRILTNKQDVSLKTCALMVSLIDFSDEDKIKFLVSVAEEKMHRASEFLSLKCGVALPITRRAS